MDVTESIWTAKAKRNGQMIDFFEKQLWQKAKKNELFESEWIETGDVDVMV